MFTRLYRRIIIKHFGGTRNFVIWLMAVLVTIYVIDSYILTKDRLSTLVNGPREEIRVVKMEQQPNVADKDAQEKPKEPAPHQRQDNGREAAVKDKGPAPPEQKPGDQDKPRPPELKQPDPYHKGETKCGVTCPPGKYAYHLKSGVGREGVPTICFNDHYAISPEKGGGHRGINIAVVNEKTLAVEEVRYFDTYVEETALVRFLKFGVKDDRVILAASQDEASFNLKEEGKKWMHAYGSSVIDKIKFRDAFLTVGQRGLSHGTAIEKHGPRNDQEFAPPIELKGCLNFPLGKLSKVDLTGKGDTDGGGEGKAGEELPECGVKETCKDDHFPVHVFSGEGNSEGPKICVGGKYVLAKGLNDGGRGFNIVVINPSTLDVVRVGHFDTYAEDSSNLEIFLEMLEEKQIIVAVTHDDASKNLNALAISLLESLGSSLISKMSFRDVWGFVGQKGMQDHSLLEDVEFSGPGNAWPKPMDKKWCVPKEMKGTKIKPDPLANKNAERRKFCQKFDGYGDFCDVQHIDEPLVPAPLDDKSLENHPIFNVPIVVIPGLAHNALRMQLETLLMNPGIQPDKVVVMYDEKFVEPSALADLFKFKKEKLTSSTKYVFQVQKALENIWNKFPKADYVIVLEEEVILSPDFLYFHAQCLSAVQEDNSLIGSMAWNENGYKGLSTMPGLAYRTETFPGLGFLLKKSFYDSHMKGKMSTCCAGRSWDGWSTGRDFEMIIPDLSRVYRRPYEGLSEQADFLTELFNRERPTNL